MATLLPRCQDDNDEECCLCYHGNSSCLPECPNGYFKVLQSVSCELEPSSSVTSNSTIDTSASTSAVTAATITTTNGSSTTATVSVNITTLVTTDVRLNISDDNVSTEVTSHSPSFPTTQMPPKPVVFVCIRNCPNGQFYNNISFKCDDCNEACINCTGPGSGNCDVCKYEYKGNCVVKCPDNTIRDQNGGNMCVDQPSDGTGGNGKSNIGGIVGGVVGSLAGIVVLGIVLFCYLRKKRTNCSGNQRGVSGKQTRHFRVSRTIFKATLKTDHGSRKWPHPSKARHTIMCSNENVNYYLKHCDTVCFVLEITEVETFKLLTEELFYSEIQSNLCPLC